MSRISSGFVDVPAKLQFILLLLFTHGRGSSRNGYNIRYDDTPQRAQYPLIKEYTLNYRGLNVSI